MSPVEELRWLEYGQRLARRERNVLTDGEGASTGAGLYRRALGGGAQTLGQRIGHIEPGFRADLLVLNGDAPTLAGKSGDTLIDAWIFAGSGNPVRDVIVVGRRVIESGHHAAGERSPEISGGRWLFFVRIDKRVVECVTPRPKLPRTAYVSKFGTLLASTTWCRRHNGLRVHTVTASRGSVGWIFREPAHHATDIHR